MNFHSCGTVDDILILCSKNSKLENQFVKLMQLFKNITINNYTRVINVLKSLGFNNDDEYRIFKHKSGRIRNFNQCSRYKIETVEDMSNYTFIQPKNYEKKLYLVLMKV